MIFKFFDNKNTMVITTKDIIERKKDVTLVFHDKEDGMWEFLDGSVVDEKRAAVVSLFEIFEIDNTINELYNLPLGGVAYRDNKNSPWNIIVERK